jgi:Asp/Glu/hydantoin racemase
MTAIARARILLLNPNRSTACSAGIDAAIAGFRSPAGPTIDVATVADGPPGIYSWQDWHAAVPPLCRAVAAQAADTYLIACASDPGIEAVREVTHRPVLGVFRCAVATALLRAERFGVIALVDASIARHALALRAIGAEPRLAAEIALNTSIEALLDPLATRAALVATGQRLVERGAGAVILGCTGMAGHRTALEEALGVPVIEPCQAAVAMARGIVVPATQQPGQQNASRAA